MKKIYQKCVALLLVAMFVFSLSATASAIDGYLANEKSKDTSFGTITGQVYVYPGADDPWDWEITAVTKVSSRYTMAQVTVKMECQYDDTGESIDFVPPHYPSNSVRNENEVGMGHSHELFDNRDLAIFTTHEATYTTSSVLYMSTLIERSY